MSPYYFKTCQSLPEWWQAVFWLLALWLLFIFESSGNEPLSSVQTSQCQGWLFFQFPQVFGYCRKPMSIMLCNTLWTYGGIYNAPIVLYNCYKHSWIFIMLYNNNHCCIMMPICIMRSYIFRMLITVIITHY